MKKRSKYCLSALLLSVLVAGSFAAPAGATPVSASTVPMNSVGPLCISPDPGYAYLGTTRSYIDWKRVYGTQGVTLQITIDQGSSVTGTVGGQVSGDVNLIVAGAQVSVNSSIALTKSEQFTQSGTWTVTGSTGWFAVGAATYAGTWQYGSWDCVGNWIVQRTGTYNLPAQMPYFYHS